VAAWSSVRRCCPPEANFPTQHSRFKKAATTAEASLPQPKNSISLPTQPFPIKSLPLLPREAIFFRIPPFCRAHLPPTSPRSISSTSNHQADKMAPEPTSDHPEHKKKVNLTYVTYLSMPTSEHAMVC
jgi:hypothetical protein